MSSSDRTLESLLERGSLDELHDVEVEAFLPGWGIVNRHDVGMADLGEGLRFAPERFAGMRGHELDAQHLHGDGTVEREVGREVHLPHAATADQPFEAVVGPKRALQPLEEGIGVHRPQRTGRCGKD